MPSYVAKASGVFEPDKNRHVTRAATEAVSASEQGPSLSLEAFLARDALLSPEEKFLTRSLLQRWRASQSGQPLKVVAFELGIGLDALKQSLRAARDNLRNQGVVAGKSWALANAEVTAEAFRELTARERQVTQRIALGETTITIAAVLGMSVSTAKIHGSRVARKLATTRRNLTRGEIANIVRQRMKAAQADQLSLAPHEPTSPRAPNVKLREPS